MAGVGHALDHKGWKNVCTCLRAKGKLDSRKDGSSAEIQKGE